MFKKLSGLLFVLTLGFYAFDAQARVVFSTEESGTHEQSFYIDSGDTADDFIDLEFGSGIDAKLRYDVVNDFFELNRSLELMGDLNHHGNTLTLDSDNTAAGANTSIIAEQGTDNNGELRYNATSNQWEVSNDGGAFQQLIGSDVCGTHGAFTGERGTVGSNQFMAFGNGRQTHGTPMGCSGEVKRIGGMCSGTIGTGLDIVLHKNNAATTCTFDMSTTAGTAVLENCSETFTGTDVLNVKTGTEAGAWTECVATFWVEYD